MNSFQLNKIIGAVLGTVFIVFSIAIVSNALFSTHAPEQLGFAIEAEEPEAGAGAEVAASGPEPVGPLLASANVSAGETVFRRCAACHTVDEGGANRVGPNLWGVVGRPVAAVEGFNYSAAMREEAEGEKSVWDYEHLSSFLLSPRTEVPGTSMGFAGLPKLEDRANLIAYLRELSNDPLPLPSPEDAAGASADDAAEAADDAAPAADDAAADSEPAEAPAAQDAEPAAEEAAPAEDAAPVEETAPADDAQDADAEPAVPDEAAGESADEADEGQADADAPSDEGIVEETIEEILPQD